MRNFTINQRIMLMIATSVATLLLIGFVGLYVSDKESGIIKRIYDDNLTSIMSLSEARQDFMGIRVTFYRYYLATDPKVRNETESRIELYVKSVMQRLNEYEKRVNADEDRKLLENDLRNLAPYINVVSKALPKIRNNEKDAELSQLMSEGSALSIQTRQR